MASRRIETQLTIKAVDQYSDRLRNMRTVTGRFADGVRTEMGRLQGLRGPLRLIEDFRRQQAVVRRSSESLDAANRRVRELARQMDNGGRSSARLRQEFQWAQDRAAELARRHGRNGEKLREMSRDMRQAGVNTGDLAGEQRRLTRALDGANSAFSRQMERMERLQTMQTRISEARSRMDESLSRAANVSFVGHASMATGRRILTSISGPVQSAIDFESAMADVRKVVDFESPEAFSQMSEDILDLSSRIPMTAEGLAQIVAAGGQAGFHQDELLDYAEAAAKVAVAFDGISAERAGTGLASIQTQLGLDLDQTSLLFDAMNHLSNNMNSTAPGLLDFTRSGLLATAEGYGFAASEALAYGSAMIASGAAPEVAATSFRNMGRALTRGASASNRQQDALAQLGLEAQDVARRMQEDASGTTIDVLERINGLSEELRPALISDLFGEEARALAPLLNDVNLLREALGLVADEQSYIGSAEQEYAARSETTAANVQRLQNNLTRLGISIGDVILPPLNELLEVSQGVISRLVDWTKEHPKLTKWLVIGAVAVGGLAVAGGALLTAAAGLIGTLAVLRFGFIGLGARAAFAAGDLLGVMGVFRGLRRLPRFALSSLVTGLSWASGLIPRLSALRFRRLATGGGRLLLSGLITPLRWASRFVPRLAWAKFIGRLVLSSLITPLTWVAGLLPNFAPALARFIGFRRDAAGEITDLATHTRNEMQGISRIFRSPVFNRALRFTGVAGAVAVAIAPTEMADGTVPDGWEPPSDASDSQVREMYAVPDELPERERQAALVVQSYRASGDLPTQQARDDLRDYAEQLRAEIADIQAQIGQMGVAPGLEVQLSARQSELASVEAELQQLEVAATELGSALQVLSGTEVMPEVNTTSIDRAIARIVELGRQMASLQSYAPTTSRPAPPRPSGARATGGPVRTGLPYLVNEDTPRSEWFVPSRSGGVLNVGQAQSVFRSHLSGIAPRLVARNPELARLHRGAQGLRAASLAVLTSSAIAAPAAAQPAQGARSGSGPVTVQIENFTVQVPSGVSDPEAIADLVSDRIGQRVAATMSASFSG